MKDEFVNEYVFRGLKAGAMYEDVYPLSTALGRPLMAKKLVEAARRPGPRPLHTVVPARATTRSASMLASRRCPPTESRCGSSRRRGSGA